MEQKYGYSYSWGKPEIADYLLNKLKPNASILDVGAGGGIYRDLLGYDFKWSAVEIWKDTADYLIGKYDKVYNIDIRNFEYTENYDLIIFGDVIEHLSVEDAQAVVDKAKQHSNSIMIAVPYMLEQDSLYGNESEKHLQADLTEENFKERYPDFNAVHIVKTGNSSIYGYYYWEKPNVDNGMNIVLCATKNMYPQLQQMIMLIANTQKRMNKIYVVVEDDITETEDLVGINATKYPYIYNNEVNGNNNWTYISFARCYLADILTDVDKILYLDLDVFFEKDISELWNIDISNYAIAGAVDVNYKEHNAPYIDNPNAYINSGVLLMNLKYIREHDYTKQMHKLLNTWKLKYPDQDVLNMVCKGHIKYLSHKWNSGAVCGIHSDPMIHHCVKTKPWMASSIWFPKWVENYLSTGTSLCKDTY